MLRGLPQEPGVCLTAQDTGDEYKQDTSYLNSQIQASLTEKQHPHEAKGWYRTEQMWSHFI